MKGLSVVSFHQHVCQTWTPKPAFASHHPQTKKILPSSPLHSLLFGRAPTSTAARHASDVSACSNDTTLSSETTAASPAEEDPYARRTAAQGTGTAYVEHNDHNVSCWDGPKPEAIRVAGSRELCESVRCPPQCSPPQSQLVTPAPPQRPRLTHPFNWSEPASSSGSTASKLGDQAQSSESLGSDPRERAGVGQRTKLPAPPTNQLRHETCVGLFGGHLLWTGFGL